MARQVILWPVSPTFEAYLTVFRDGQMVRSMFFTIRLTAIFTVIGMIVTICAAYPLAQAKLKGRTFFSFIFMFTMLFSAGLIPDFMNLHRLNLINTMWVLILPLVFAPFNILLMRTYFQSSIPDSLYEAADLDGCSHFRTLFSIVLPLSKPILATISLFFAVGRWNAFADARFFVTSHEYMPLQLMLANMTMPYNFDAIAFHEAMHLLPTPEVLRSATVMFATIPIVMVYPFIQKYFVKGVMIGSLKG